VKPLFACSGIQTSLVSAAAAMYQVQVPNYRHLD